MNLFSVYKDFGYKCLGPLLCGYSQWLMENFKKEGIKKIFFLSRDGYIMKKAFNLLYINENIETYYLEVSRRSLRVPILWKDYSIENLLTMISPSMIISLNSIFDAVGLDIGDYQALLIKYGFNEHTKFYRQNILQNKEFLCLYKELEEDIKVTSLNEYKYLKEYIRQSNIGGKFAIVDIGWSGGMQRFLNTTLQEMGIECDIYGYYTGIAEYYKRNVATHNSHLAGYLFDFSKNSKDYDCRSCFVGLYEMLFLEPRGSVKNYQIDSRGNVYAERYPYEYMGDDKLQQEMEAITNVQQGALDFIKDNQHTIITPKQACKSLIYAGQTPTKEAVSLFCDFHFFDEGDCLNLAKPKQLSYYITHLHDFKEDFIRSRWKTAFLRKTFRIPISYVYMYNLFKQISKIHERK